MRTIATKKLRKSVLAFFREVAISQIFPLIFCKFRIKKSISKNLRLNYHKIFRRLMVIEF